MTLPGWPRPFMQPPSASLIEFSSEESLSLWVIGLLWWPQMKALSRQLHTYSWARSRAAGGEGGRGAMETEVCLPAAGRVSAWPPLSTLRSYFPPSDSRVSLLGPVTLSEEAPAWEGSCWRNGGRGGHWVGPGRLQWGGSRGLLESGQGRDRWLAGEGSEWGVRAEGNKCIFRERVILLVTLSCWCNVLLSSLQIVLFKNYLQKMQPFITCIVSGWSPPSSSLWPVTGVPQAWIHANMNK